MTKKTDRPQIQIIDALSGEEIIRDMNDEELKAALESSAQIEAHQAELNAKAAARLSALAKLKKLGLTAAEIEAL